jgi:putative endonuclease
MTSKDIGNEGELAAALYLEQSGSAIIDTNIRPLAGMRRGEMDIVAWDGDVFCVIEVKTRASRRFDATEAVTVTKRRKLTLLAQAYMGKYRLNTSECRFDVVCVYNRDNNVQPIIEVIKGAFDPLY